ncbi:MAG: AsmA-like C-terminal region-containing protein [Desulfatiglandaceae bacterium]
MSEKRLRSFLFPAVLLFLLFCACFLFVNDLIQRPDVQRFLVRKISEAAGFHIKVDSFDINLLRGFGITAHGLSATSDDRKDSLTASRAGIGLDAKALLRGHIIPTNLSLDNPIIVMSPKRAEKKTEGGVGQTLVNAFIWNAGVLRSVNILGGQVKVKGWPYHLKELTLHMGVRKDEGSGRYFGLRCRLGFQGRYLPLSLQGTLQRAIDGNRLLADISCQSGTVPASWVPWPRFVAFSGGTLGVKLHVKGTLGGTLSAEGDLNGRDLHFTILRGSRRKTYDLASLPMAFTASLDNKKTFRIRIPGVKLYKTSLAAQIAIDTKDQQSPRLDLSITSPFMPLKTFKTVFPTSLVPEWIEKGLFPRLADGEVKTQLFRLEGTMDEISHLGRPGNFHALSMKVVWRGLKALEHVVPLPFETISGEMEIKENHLLISRLKGRFGHSEVHKGTLEVHPLAGGPHRYDVGLDGDFFFEDLLTLKSLPWTPNSTREMLAGLQGSSGPVSASVKLFRKPGGSAFHAREALLHLGACSIVHEGLFFPLTVKLGEIKIAKSGPVRFSGNGTWGRSELQIAGMSEQSGARGYAKVTGNIDLDELAAEVTKRKEWDVHLGKPASCNVNIKKEGSSWSFNGTLDMEKGTGLMVGPLSIGSPNKKNALFIDATYLPGKAFIFRNFNGEFGRSVFAASGNVDFSKQRSLKVDVSTPGLFLKDLGIRLGRKGPSLEGLILGKIVASIPLNDPLSSEITGKLEARHLHLPLIGLPHPLREGRFKAIFSGKEISIPSLGFKVGKSSVEIRGKLTGREPLQGNLLLQSAYLDTADFYGKRAGRSEKSPEAIWRYLQQEKTDLAVSVKVSQAHWRKMKFGPVTGQCAFQGGDFHLKSSTVRMKHGTLTTAGDIIKKDGNQITLLSHIRLFRQPVQELIGNFSDKPSFIEGRLSTDILLSAKGKDKASLVAGLDGKGKMLIEKGKILKSNVLIQVMDFLSLQKIFRHPPPDLSKKGFYFDNIGCDFVIKRGLLNTENLVMKSPVFNAAIRGRLDLTSSKIKADLHVQPLVTMDSLVSKIPIVGYILTGKDKSLLVYYFRVKGPIASPEVIYVPLKHWGNSIMGYVTRAFLTPPRLFEKLRKLLKPPEN